MSFRSYLEKLESRGELLHIKHPIAKTYEIAGVLKALEPKHAMFDQVSDSAYPVIGNVICTKAQLADHLGISIQELIPTLAHAIEHPTSPAITSSAPCQEVVDLSPTSTPCPSRCIF